MVGCLVICKSLGLFVYSDKKILSVKVTRNLSSKEYFYCLGVRSLRAVQIIGP